MRSTAPDTPKIDKHMLGVFRYTKRAIGLVWQTSPRLTVGLAIATLFIGILPALMAYVGQLLVDSVVTLTSQTQPTESWLALRYVILEGILVLAFSASQRASGAMQALLRAQLGQKVNVMILQKAQDLSLAQFEDSELYDKLTQARREASTRPLALVNKTLSLLQHGITLSSFAVLLWQFSPWALIFLVFGALPGFIAEAKFSNDAFLLFRWRSPEVRQQAYLETLIAREDNIKEIRLFQLGRSLLERYRAIHQKLFRENRKLILRREWWGFLLGIISTGILYSAYIWIVFDTIQGHVTLGQMTMYLLLFKQGQTAVTTSLTSISGMYEDNLYLSNLYDYLNQPTSSLRGTRTAGIAPGEGIYFKNVSFTYPGAKRPALNNVSLRIKPSESLAIVGENGSGKTTLIKLLTRLYEPTDGVIYLDGTALYDWQEEALLKRIGVIFQDFVRYQFTVGENIGVGDNDEIDNKERWRSSAEKGKATDFIDRLSDGYHTQLGRWFKNGQELSGGQWQKIALSRAFMRTKADILVLDEPTAAMDAKAEADIFNQFHEYSRDKMIILISHRFSTVRLASQIIVMNQGEIIEHGTHEDLLKAGKQYAELFNQQAKGYM
ncbi:ABC transporter ATP-binding protein [Maribrevibacterium harenarium]|uniref:ABC transporter ATP-binding protein n=1 Tax=Maribrevibacterium harenarium TaxID=2589817 RepID=A0A501X2D0_9GAMM|nr:ABC transporter ATP-binding protein [Maribrevibacterium harenarium]TPE54642.1 ABC transporter ATP-binding protein [Maribrevibacterium harenarium]